MDGVACSPVLLGHVPGPTGEWIEELTEKPQHVTVTVLSSTTALTSWTASHESSGNSTIVSVLSLTCQKQKESQRLEKHYCTEVRSRSWSIFQSSKKNHSAVQNPCAPGLCQAAGDSGSPGASSENVQVTPGLVKCCFCWACCGSTQACAAVHL